MNKGLALTNIMITSLVAALIGAAVVLPIVHQTVLDSTQTYDRVNQTTLRTFNATNLTSISLPDRTILINDTAHPFAVYRTHAIGDRLTNDVNFTLSKNGTIRILNVSASWNASYPADVTYWQVSANYTYTGSDYLDNAVQRAMIKQIPIIVALMLIVAFAGYIALAMV